SPTHYMSASLSECIKLDNVAAVKGQKTVLTSQKIKYEFSKTPGS
ncbi:unnamed protein product, partial [Didymodactylos carnosus]